MRRDEAAALGSLTADGLGGAATRAQELHRAITGRVFGALGPQAAPIQTAHDALSQAIYAGVRVAGSASLRTAGTVVGASRPADAPALLDAPKASFALGALNGILGDRLHERESALAVGMTVRAGNRDVPLTPDAIAAAHPDAGPRVAVFLHGLCETDISWRLGTAQEAGPPLPTYAERLQADMDLSPVTLRYNTGRRISQNGRELDRLLHALVTHWPCEVRELVLVGHSMGGLVIRSACHVADATRRPWRDRVTHVVMLGTPHLGAPLEQQVNQATRLMRRLPETLPLAAVLDVRSAGIRDLRFGAITDEDWDGHDPDHVDDPCGDVPLLPGVRHCTIAATLTTKHDAHVGRIFGDLLVTHSSSTGVGHKRKIAFSADDTVHLGGVSHFALLNHPRVYEQLHDWLAVVRPDVPALAERD